MQGNLWIEVESEDEPGRVLRLERVAPDGGDSLEIGGKMPPPTLPRPQLILSNLDDQITLGNASNVRLRLLFWTKQGCMSIRYASVIRG